MKLITYDLNTPGKNYQALYNAIQSLGEWWHYLDSNWLVDTTLNTYQISDRLRQCIDSNDRLLIVEIDPSTVSGWLPKDACEWISARTRRMSPFR
jgi:hypothetical protein